MPNYTFIREKDGAKFTIAGDKPPSQEVVEHFSKQIPLKTEQTQQVKEETLVKNIKTFEDISSFYLYSPFYIPFLVLVFFSILIIKKKIKSGWARIGACLSIIWTLFCVIIIFLESPSSSDSYNFAISQINSSLLLNVLCLIPFVLFFIIYRTIKWILEGFKK